MDELEDIDERPGLFVGLTAENLARHAARYPRTSETPAPIADLLAEARRMFVGAAACYDNLASAAFKSLQAAELALRVRTGQTDNRVTLGRLLHSPAGAAVLSPNEAEWFLRFALPFRNRLAHPNGPTAMTPGLAEPFLRSAHEAVARLFPDAPSTST